MIAARFDEVFGSSQYFIHSQYSNVGRQTVAILMPIMKGTLKDLVSNKEYHVERVEEWAR